MRLLRILLAFAAGGVAASASAGPYGMAGCGLGSLVFTDNDQIQILVATTNGTFGSQTFGITSGTSNCLPPRAAQAEQDQEDFINGNLASLYTDIAKGSGESLTAFSAVLGCQNQDFPEFAGLLQQAHGAIFAHPGAISVLHAATDQVRTHAALASRCDKLI